LPDFAELVLTQDNFMAKKPLTKIKSGVFSRGFAMARMTATLSARAAAHAAANALRKDDHKQDSLRVFLSSQAQTIADELGQLKGSAMKAGQMLSMFGEHFLPPEANLLLKKLQNQTTPVSWSAIDKALQAELGAERLGELDIDQTPLGTASLGQVHKAVVKATGQHIVLKVQYPGVAGAVDADIRTLRRLLSMARLIPQSSELDPLFDEVKEMLTQEADYAQERLHTERFRAALLDDARFVVPTTIGRYCTGKVLATSFEQGVAVDGPEVAALPLQRRNALAQSALSLYLKELFVLRRVQTDPHFGNYRVRLGEAQMPDRLVLLDFGAVRVVSEDYVRGYRDLIAGSCDNKPEQCLAGATVLGLMRPDDTKARCDAFVALCHLFCEPFCVASTPGLRRDLFLPSGAYDFGASDLPARVARLAAQSVGAMGLRAPPRESLFLDRKLAGVFIFMSTLKACFVGRPVLKEAVPLVDEAALGPDKAL
jgi:predicted unusual protein kinase regulating ubiquinone biosynthesis (AarF/ABC1/UbiB family)